MGILGLTTFISKYSDQLFENFFLHDCSLVIDGNSLAVQIYQNVSKCNSAYGGDYDEYSKAIKKFFTSLTKCNIIPYVVCDGGYEDKKMKTVLKRLRCRIVDASRVNPVNQAAYLVFPLLMKDVFVEVLHSLNVKCTFCEYEADHEIAALARYLECPVLSYDSDFFIYNVPYIPFPSLILKPTAKKKEHSSYWVLKCKLFKVEKFVKFFDGLEPDVLPLIATLLGNDYVKRSIFSKFYHNLKQPKSKKRTQGQCRISGLIEWFKTETYDSAVVKVLNRFKLSERNRVQRAIQESCSNYTRTYCNLLSDLDIPNSHESNEQTLNLEIPSVKEFPVDISGEDNSLSSSSSSDCSSDEELESLMEYTDIIENKPICYSWVLALLKKGRVSPRFFDLIHKSLYIASPQVEDFSLHDSNLSSLPILKFNFNIISGFKIPHFLFQGRKNLTNKVTTIDCSDFLLDSFCHNLVDEDKMPGPELFYKFIEQSLERPLIDNVTLLPGHLQMFVLVILWMKKQNGGAHLIPSENHIYSLILCQLTLSVIKKKIGGNYMHFEFNSKFSSDIQRWLSLNQGPFEEGSLSVGELDENKILYEDCMVAASHLLKYFEVDSKACTSVKLFKRECLHLFAQFQCILQQFSYLNVLTSEPLQSCKVSESYNGTFIYNMFLNLRKRNDPGAYVYQLLKSSPTVLKYVIIVTKFLGYESCCLLDSSVPRNKTKVKNKKKKEITDTSPVNQVESEDICDDEETHDVNNRTMKDITKCLKMNSRLADYMHRRTEDPCVFHDYPDINKLAKNRNLQERIKRRNKLATLLDLC